MKAHGNADDTKREKLLVCEDYETKQSEEKHDNLGKKSRLLLSWFNLFLVIAPILFLLIAIPTLISSAYLTSPDRSYFHGINILTLLSIYDGHHYLNALDNPLYQNVINGTFYNNYTVGTALLTVTPSNIQPKGNLTVRWSNGTIYPTDVLILICTDDDDDDDDNNKDNSDSILQYVDDPKMILEATTILYARTTSIMNGGSTTNGNEWFIKQFPVLRYDYCRFLLYRKQGNEYYKITHSNIITLQLHKYTPVGIHIAYTSDYSAMTVHFQTGLIDNTQPVVMYADIYSEDYTYIYGGTTTTYTANDMCQPPANQYEPGKFSHPGALHTLTLTDLEAGYTYNYKVGLQNLNDESIIWSSEEMYQFTAALQPGDTTPFSYLVYGDQGCPKPGGWENGQDWMKGILVRSEQSDYPITQLHHFGDLSYAFGASHQWDAWLDMVEIAASKLPLMIALGNHEYCYTYVDDDSSFRDPSLVKTNFMPEWGNFDNDSRGECGIPVSSRFTMPNTGNGLFWYSYEYATLHTIVLSSEHNLTIGSPQYEWLAQDLANTDRSTTPWIVVELHRPLYESEVYWSDNDVGIAMRGEIEDLLFQYGVDLVLAGHYHAYLRTCDQLYRSKCGVSGAPIHITVGTAGVDLDPVGLYPNDWTQKYINTEYGYGRITIYNSTVMHFEFIRAGGVNDEYAGETLDHVWLFRDR